MITNSNHNHHNNKNSNTTNISALRRRGAVVRGVRVTIMIRRVDLSCNYI